MKYLFIDTNIYKYLFNENTTFSKDILDLINKLITAEKLILLLPTQVIDEVKRNHLENWLIQECNEREKKKESTLKDFELQINYLNNYPKIKKLLEKERDKYIKNHNKELEKIKKRYRDKNSESIKYFEDLIKISTPINSDDVINKALIRNYKNNPPYDKVKITDAIIWESILSFFKKENKKAILYFLSDDGCYGKEGFNPFLTDELKQFKVTIHFRKSITSLKDLLGNDIDKIIEQEKEEKKNKAITDFINSDSWRSAGDNFGELLKFKDSLTLGDYRNIMSASTTNDQIYNSVFVNLSRLIEDKDNVGFVIPIIEEIDDNIWWFLKDKRKIFLSRQKDVQKIYQQI